MSRFPTRKTVLIGSPLPAHLPALDGMRGLAVLWVVMHNISVAEESLLSDIPGRLLVAALDSGWAAVTMFFALSGFLITGILLDSRGQPGYYTRFWKRRVLRIFPLYYAVLIVAFLVLPHFITLPTLWAEDRAHQVWLWTYLSNWMEPFGIVGMALPHFWSLAVEEQFYLVWPFLVSRCTPRRVIRLCAALAVIAFLFRLGLYCFHAPKVTYYMFTFARMDALALGSAAAAALRIPEWRARLVAAAPGLVLGCALLFVVFGVLQRGLPPFSIATGLVGHSVLAIAFGMLVLGLAAADCAGNRSWWARMWRIAPLRVLAKYSYGMYIFHKIIADAIGRPTMRAHPLWLRSISANVVYLAIGVVVILLTAMLSYHLFEKRFLQLRPAPSYGGGGAAALPA